MTQDQTYADTVEIPITHLTDVPVRELPMWIDHYNSVAAFYHHIGEAKTAWFCETRAAHAARILYEEDNIHG